MMALPTSRYTKRQAMDQGVLINNLIDKHWDDIQFEARVDGMGKQAATMLLSGAQHCEG